jgi:hypothetical protein
MGYKFLDELANTYLSGRSPQPYIRSRQAPKCMFLHVLVFGSFCEYLFLL